MITENNAEISQDYIDFCLALSREKAVRDYDSCIAEAEERGAAKQRDADRAEIARLLEEVNRLKAAVSESKN